LVKCSKCGADIPLESAFCPNCGATLERKMSDEEISRLIFPMFGKKYDEALSAASAACLQDLENGALHRNLLLKFPVPDLMPRESQYHDEAVRRFIERSGSDSRLREALGYYKLGLIYENGKKLKEASKEYDKAISLFPAFASAHLRRGMLHEVFGDKKSALRSYLTTGEVDPQFPLAFFDQGLMYKHLGKRDEALESYGRCVALDPDIAAAHNNMGLIYIDKGDYDNAEREFSEILRIFPNHPTGVKNLEIAKKRVGRGGFKLF
jgi:tetratricopeptide (TPR) repeat protein